jgi:hypothetical protein
MPPGRGTASFAVFFGFVFGSTGVELGLTLARQVHRHSYCLSHSTSPLSFSFNKVLLMFWKKKNH